MTALTLSGLSEATGNGFSGWGGRPLALLTFALDHLRAGPDAAALKLTNIMIHALNTALVFALVRKLFELGDREREHSLGIAFSSAAVAIAWSIHPLQASTVLYIVQRMELGATTFTLLACLAYIRARTQQMSNRPGTHWFALSGIAIVVGTGFKESAVLAPAFATVIEFFVLRFEGPQDRVKWVKRAILTGILVAGIAFLAIIAPYYTAPERYAFREFDATERVMTQGPVLMHYLSQVLLPLPERLSFHYDNFPTSRSLTSPPWTLIAWMIIVALTIATIALRRRHPLTALGILWFFAAHGLTSNVVPLEIAFEHRNYLALLGPLLAIADQLRRPLSAVSVHGRAAIAIALVVTIGVLGALQAMTWGDPMRLASSLAGRNPDSPRASYGLGRTFFDYSHGDMRAPSWSLAKKQFMHASDLAGRSPLPEQALIIMHARDQSPLPELIWPRLKNKFRRYPLTPEAEGSLWQLSACLQFGQCPIDEQSLLETFLIALERNPGSAKLYSIYATFALNVIADRTLAIDLMRKAIRLAPREVQFQANLAKFLVCDQAAAREFEQLLTNVKQNNKTGAFQVEIGEIERLKAACSATSNAQ